MPSGLLRAAVLFLILVVGGSASAQPAERKEEAARAMDRGSQAMAAGEFEVAVGFFRTAKALLPNASGPRLALGLALRAVHECREAIVELEAYLQRKPQGDPRAVTALKQCRDLVGANRVVLPTSPTGPPPPAPDTPVASRPWYKRWYVWTAIGVAVVGGIVGGAVAGTRGSDGVAIPNTTLGTQAYFR